MKKNIIIASVNIDMASDKNNLVWQGYMTI